MFKSAKSCSLNTKLGFHFGVNFQKTVFWNLSRVALLISVAGETLTQALNISSNFIKKVLKSLASLGTTIFFSFLKWPSFFEPSIQSCSFSFSRVGLRQANDHFLSEFGKKSIQVVLLGF